MAKRQKRKARPSWFQKQIERDGAEFLLRKTPLDIQREAFNIVRDITRGNITMKDFPYLFDLKIIGNVEIAVYDKYTESATIVALSNITTQIPNGAGLLMAYGVSEDNFRKVCNKHNDLLTAYGAILNGLNAFKSFIQNPYTKSEEDLLQIYDSVQYQLSRFRHII